MELYILDSLLRRTVVIDRFESMIWTERYSAWGDFELVIFSTQDSRKLFTAGTMLAMSDSYRVMTVEFTENKIDSEGRQLLTVKGRSLEAILDDRTARNTFADLNVTPKWVLTGTPGNIARKIFNDICRTNVNYGDDEIPFLELGSIFPPSNLEEPDAVITVELSLQSVYTAIRDICDAYDLGFRLVRNFDLSELYFDVYSGSDRTTGQTVLAPVVFSPNLDNLTNTSEISSISTYKNVAYVFHTVGVQVVTADGVSVEVEGFDRRVMHVDATDIEVPERAYDLTQAQLDAINAAYDLATNGYAEKAAMDALRNKKRLTPDQVTIAGTIGSGVLTTTQTNAIKAARDVSVAYNATENAYMNPLLIQRGNEELAKNRSLAAFDGELPGNNPYKYNTHYNLGDLVEMQNGDGVANQMRVTEQIFVSDSEGERSYPTLTVDLFITSGSWISWTSNEVWLDAEGTWAFAGGMPNSNNILLNGGFEKGSTIEWAAYSGSTVSTTTTSTEKRSGDYAGEIVTTSADGGTAQNISRLGDTPEGLYKGGAWVKGTSGHEFTFRIQEYTTASVLVGETIFLFNANGAWLNVEATITKTQSDSVIRISVKKSVAGTFWVDDAYINKV